MVQYIIRSPIVGTFYRSDLPYTKVFVKVGDKVKPGNILCIIEAMKSMNKIKCDKSGIIKAILVENGNAVDFDEPLIVIE